MCVSMFIEMSTHTCVRVSVSTLCFYKKHEMSMFTFCVHNEFQHIYDLKLVCTSIT
jgi:hypothetical protein